MRNYSKHPLYVISRRVTRPIVRQCCLILALASMTFGTTIDFDSVDAGPISGDTYSAEGVVFLSGSVPDTLAVGSVFTISSPDPNLLIVDSDSHISPPNFAAASGAFFGIADDLLMTFSGPVSTVSLTTDAANPDGGGADIVRLMALEATGNPGEFRVLDVVEAFDDEIAPPGNLLTVTNGGVAFRHALFQTTTEPEGFDDLNFTLVPDCVASTFDSDLEGWTVSSSQEDIMFRSTGGDPGGHLFYLQGGTPAPTFAIAPSEYHGDWTGFLGGALSFDQIIIDPGPSATPITERVITISGPGGSATFSFGPVAAEVSQWQRYSAPIKEASWLLTSGTWSALIQNVTDLRISVEHFSNGGAGEDNEMSGLDDIVLRAAADLKASVEFTEFKSGVWTVENSAVNCIYVLKRSEDLIDFVEVSRQVGNGNMLFFPFDDSSEGADKAFFLIEIL